MCRNDFVFYDKHKVVLFKEHNLPISQDCLASLSVLVSTGCCGDLPSKILDVHFVP